VKRTSKRGGQGEESHWQSGKSRLYIKVLLLMSVFLSAIGHVSAQDNPSRTVSGVVADAGTDETLPGVNIIIKGSTTGTVSNMDGEFSLQVPGPEAVLVFSFIGYIKQEVVVGNQNTIDVNLDSDAADLDEVVVVGYGTVKKKDLTGS